ncbi:MAG TPA: hypothetical protein ENK66_11365 [Arcobacter sp.]|nr:hypothetical protein [Arcobacter sp.]
MKIAIMQPTFNPWLGYFDLIEYVDKFIFLDTVQLNQQSWQTRNKLLIQNKEHLFPLPIIKNKDKKELKIEEALLDFRKYDFRKKLYRTLEQNYKKSKFYTEVNTFIKSLVLYDTDYLSEYNINIIQKISQKFEFDTKFIVLSQSNFETDKAKGDLVLDICKFYQTSEYISPLGSKEYLDKSLQDFIDSKIEVFYQYYNHPIYNQLGKEFIPYIGIFDLLYNEGFEKSREIILSGREYKKAKK